MSTETEQVEGTRTQLRDQLEKTALENQRLKARFGSVTKQVRELNEFIQIMLTVSPFAICIIQQNKLIFTNKAFSEILGYSAKQLRNLPPSNLVFKEDRDHVRKSVRAMLTGNAQSFFMFRVLTRDEKIKWILGSVALIHMNEKQAVIGNFVDLTEGRVMQLAYSDPLTGLPNRKLVLDRLEQAIVSAKRRCSKLAVLFVDLDEFKEVNDAHGHKTGDRLLIEIANRMKQVIRRENDTIARIGGDEFLVLLTDIEQESQIETVVVHLFDTFRAPVAVGKPPGGIKVNFSIGVALFPEHGQDPDVLISNADQAMYRAKKKPGKNHFSFFHP
ncbi:MAG: sensor domain-containing diguanylate cyclase [Smithellaceae bacterium]|nr:GGDEF domain-containing protein [Syntrophaceae bacterium]MDD4240747.1 sensor domain-containing diguanylate cyclase [Smithellaceae bacterium]NLX50716.1 diguanylate cyclase [Deltaproteobacteria bacterium]